jgi:RimJ/RimL family protein N-acetyltransferase
MIPAPSRQFADLLALLGPPRFNVYFARAVLEGRVGGTAYVDDPVRPRAAYILHPCGMSLLCGTSFQDPFRGAFVDYMLDVARRRSRVELVQIARDPWNDVLAGSLGPRLLRLGDPRRRGLDIAGVRKLGQGSVIEWRRLNYEFNRAAFEAAGEAPVPEGFSLRRAGREAFRPWAGSVTPHLFWDSPEQFERDGVAFAAYRGDRPVCVAFSAWILDGILELGIETLPEARGRGLARAACAALIRHALSAGLEPVWSSHRDNLPSQSLAGRLGFRITLNVPYYGMVENGG